MPERIITLFPTKILTGRFPSGKLNRDLLKEIAEFSSQDKMGQQWSRENYKGGYTSYASLSDMHHRAPAFMKLAEWLEGKAKQFAKIQNWDRRGLKLEMTACWMNQMGKGCHHTLHNHPHSVISGVYYVKVPKGSAALKMEDPRIGFYMNAPLKKKPGLYHVLYPEPGSYVLFESWLRHEVPPHFLKEPRVSISFNFELSS